jgi:hypothetical protein
VNELRGASDKVESRFSILEGFDIICVSVCFCCIWGIPK